MDSMAKSLITKVNKFALEMLKDEENRMKADDYYRLIKNAEKYERYIKVLKVWDFK